MDGRMAWVQRNRARRGAWQPAGAAVQRLMGTLQSEADTPAAALAEALAGLVDEDFRQHCRVGGVSGSVAAIHVDQPTLVSVMRNRWLKPVRRTLGTLRGRHRVRDVVFRYGTTGMPLPLPSGS